METTNTQTKPKMKRRRAPRWLRRPRAQSSTVSSFVVKF